MAVAYQVNGKWVDANGNPADAPEEQPTPNAQEAHQEPQSATEAPSESNDTAKAQNVSDSGKRVKRPITKDAE